MRKEFEKKYGGKKDVPIFSDPRVVPTFHGVGPASSPPIAKTGEVLEAGKQLRQMARRPSRPQVGHDDELPRRPQPVGDKGSELFAKYRDRYVGSIAGESLGYFDVRRQDDAGGDRRRPKRGGSWSRPSRRCSLQANAAKYRQIYGKDLDTNAYADVIPCLSVGNIAYAPLVLRLGRAHDRLRIVGGDVVAAADALGVHARRGPAARRPDGHLSLLQLRRLLHDLQRSAELHQPAATSSTTITASSPARA